ncbi:MAG: hypothetical protein P0Y60_00605 [Candidatus Microbacterium colombiense]|nr:MAG: hypothetical protein P0Y60_00605 [Microbacterium sp.]
MYSFMLAESGSSDQFWNWFLATREVGRALTAVEEAAGGLRALVAASEWHADGVRALHDLLRGLQSRAETTMGELHVRAWELSRMGEA